MTYITHEDMKELKTGVVPIYKMLKLRKLCNLRKIE